MYFIKPQNSDGFFTANVRFIKVSTTSGSYIGADENDAQGAVCDGTAYSINSENPIKDLESAEIVPMAEWSEDISAQYDKKLTEQAKPEKIAKSKLDLQTYLAEHPLQWTDGKYYTITADKQQQLTSKLVSANFAAQAGQEYNLTWNDTEQICVPWTVENLTALAFAIDARVTALVTYQQHKEVEIRNAETLDELESIVVDYDEVI